MPLTTRAICALCSIILSTTGAFLLIFLAFTIASGDLEHWVVASQCLAIILIALTALACLTRARWAYPIAMLTTALTYLVTAVSLAVGPWSWGAITNAGSAYYALAIGNTIIQDGDCAPVRINPSLWLIEVTILTALTILIARAIIKHFRRNNTQQA